MSRYGIIELHDNYDFNAPTSYRELVRCEDCKYCSKGWVYARTKDGQEKIVNECRRTRPFTSVKLDHYCSYGEREGE